MFPKKPSKEQMGQRRIMPSKVDKRLGNRGSSKLARGERAARQVRQEKKWDSIGGNY